jgi:hypothetical protein
MPQSTSPSACRSAPSGPRPGVAEPLPQTKRRSRAGSGRPPSSGPPSTTKPSSTREFIKRACSFHVDAGTALQTVNHEAEDLVLYVYEYPPEEVRAEILDSAI